MNTRTVILNNKQWMVCWKDMCDHLGYVPAWDEYYKHFQYFGGISYEGTPDEGFRIIFDTSENAMAFKLTWT